METRVVSLTAPEAMLKKMADFYYETRQDSTDPYVLFVAKAPNCTVRAYRSGKVVFQGRNATNEALIWQEQLPQALESSWIFTDTHAGSDEVGTGDYFGPVVVVAAFVEAKDLPFLQAIGVADSKTLSDNRIREIAPKLLKRITYSQLHLSNEKYNDLVNKGFNMNRLKAYLHNQALLHIRAKVNQPIPYFVVDQFTPEHNYYQYLDQDKRVERNIRFVTKGESKSPAVAVASILARYSFLAHLNRLEHTYKIQLPKGAGALVDRAAARYRIKLGDMNFAKIAKLNFKNTKKAEELMNNE